MPSCPTCGNVDRVMPAEEAIEFLREEGQLDEWTAAALGEPAALRRIREREGLMFGDSYPRDYYCDVCFTTFS